MVLFIRKIDEDQVDIYLEYDTSTSLKSIRNLNPDNLSHTLITRNHLDAEGHR